MSNIQTSDYNNYFPCYFPFYFEDVVSTDNTVVVKLPTSNDIDDDNVLSSVKVNENDIRYWARLYASQIKIIEPKELVDMSKQDMENALKLYEN